MNFTYIAIPYGADVGRFEREALMVWKEPHMKVILEQATSKWIYTILYKQFWNFIVFQVQLSLITLQMIMNKI